MSTDRAREATAIVALGVVLAILMTWPVASQFTHGGRVESGDGQFSIWNVAWVARTLVAAPRSLFDANIFYPERHALAFSEANIGAGVLAIPAYWLTRNPYVAHNTVLLIAFVLALVAMYYLARHLTGSGLAAVAPAIAFAFCPYIFARIPHIQLQMTAGLPLSLLAFHRLVEQRTLARSVALGLALSAQALSCAYYGVFAGLTVGFGVIFYAVSRRLWRDPRYWLAVAGAAAVSIAIVLPFFMPYLEIQRDAGFGRSLDDARQYQADWRAYFASAAWAHRWMLPWLDHWAEVLFPGFITAILAVAGLWLGTRRRDDGSRSLAGRDTPVFYGVLAALTLWASFGPKGGLYTLFYRTIPIFSFLRAPSRFGLMVTLSLVVLSAFAIERLLAGRPLNVQRRWCAALGALMVLELVTIPIRWREAPPVFRTFRTLPDLPPGPVLEMPFFSERIDFHRHALYMLESTYYWMPLVNGYSDHIPKRFRDIAGPLSSFPTRESFKIIEPLGVKYVIFHMDMYDSRSRDKLVERLRAYQFFLKPLVLEGGVWLYEIVGWPR